MSGWRDGEAVNTVVCKTTIRRFESDSRLIFYSMEREKSETKSQDETGFSEKQLDIDVETGAFKRKKVKKTLFKKKGS